VSGVRTNLDDLKSRPGNSCAEVAVRLGAQLRRYGREQIGPCPICSTDLTSKTATRWQTKAGGWVCAVCCDGGDVVRLVERAMRTDFKGAVDWLGGLPDDRDSAADNRRDEALAKEEKRRAEADRYRERERAMLYGIWRDAADPQGTLVQTYLENRGIPLPMWREGCARLRYAERLPYFHGTAIDETGRNVPAVIHRGPAMLAPVTREGRFRGLHMTYLDEDGNKVDLRDRESGVLPAKKIRGSKQAGAAELIKVFEPKRIIIGEGIETVLSVWHSLAACGEELERTEFWSALDLGNLGGKAKATVTHPELKTEKGRPQRVPGPDADLDKPGIALPDSVVEVVILGDGDSDRVTTEYAIARAVQRFRGGGGERKVRAAWADPGRDFNDMLLGD